jgi:hypothetical protein
MKQKAVLASSIAMLLLAALTACSAPQTSPPSDDSSSATETGDEERDLALADYVETERAAIPTIMDQNAGVYSSVEVDGRFVEPDGGSDVLPAVMFYNYVFAEKLDWSVAGTGLDAQKPALDDACSTQIYPAMRAAGVTGPVGAVFSYSDGSETSGPSWEHTCAVE